MGSLTYNAYTGVIISIIDEATMCLKFLGERKGRGRGGGSHCLDILNFK